MRKWLRNKTGEWIATLAVISLVIFGAWSAWWFTAQAKIEKFLHNGMTGVIINSPYQPAFEGFPGAITIIWPTLHILTPDNTIDVAAVEAKIWPLPGARATFDAAGITIQTPARGQTIQFDSMNAELRLPSLLPNPAVTLRALSLARAESVFESTGNVKVPLDAQMPIAGNLKAKLTAYGDFIDYLIAENMADEQSTRMARSFMDGLAITQGTPGTLNVPMLVQKNWLYVGPLRIVNLRPGVTIPSELAPASGSD
ncbi:MAG TPA: DUF2125 domain-containing protein [Alphaproteobacteria bacterium]